VPALQHDQRLPLSRAGGHAAALYFRAHRHEHFILRNRRILADQMEYLLAGVPKSSRLYLSDPLS
jgi:hypothetical protein